MTIIHNQFQAWMERINKVEKVEIEITAFNFGIFETTQGYSIYLTGSKVFDEQDDDWVCSVDFQPDEKYLNLNLPSIPDKKWEAILLIMETELTNYISSVQFKASILKDAIAITTGFEDGDLIRVK